MGYKIYSIITHDKALADIQLKTRLDNYFQSISMETTFTNVENSKTNELHELVLNFSQRSDLRSTNEHVSPQN